jgi:Bifunctional DNA primase/polymerase, N-terminal/AAA domain
MSRSLAYAAAGFFVFPCSAERYERKPNDRLPFGKAKKIPVGVSSWSKDATIDEKQIREWWQKYPQALVGLPCKQNRLFVIDCDRHTARQDGVTAYAALCEGRDEPMPPHPVICTDYEGEHHLFLMPDEPIGQGKSKLPPGIETRGFQRDNDGGYVIASGSRMPDGRRWKRLDGTPRLTEKLPLPPQWLIELCQPPQIKPPPVTIIQLKPTGKNEEAYAMSALNRVASELAATSEGHRDNSLMSVAGTMGRMVKAGWIGYATVEGRLIDACDKNKLLREVGDTKLRDKIKRSIESVSPHEPLVERPAQKGNDSAHDAHSLPSAGERSIVAIRGDKVKPESISWAWKNRFAFGKMAMIAGDPGLGKSTLLVEVAALHTIGGDFPCGEGKAILCEVAILTAEDGLHDTLAPRLIAAGADMSKIHFIAGTKFEGGDDNNGAAMFDIAQDVATLRKYLKDNPAIKILIIDPLTAYLGAGTKAKENTDVRRVLTPLIKLIEDFGIALLANNHLNKSGGKALYRILDSIAFTAVGRVIHLVIEDADNRDLKKFICSKINIGSMPLGLTYIIQKIWIDGEQGEKIETSRISWGIKHIDETADEALGGGDDAPTMADDAEKFLRVVLASGRVIIDEIVAEARAAGLLGADKEIRNSKPFRTACERLGVIHDREGFGRGAKYYWRLP